MKKIVKEIFQLNFTFKSYSRKMKAIDLTKKEFSTQNRWNLNNQVENCVTALRDLNKNAFSGQKN